MANTFIMRPWKTRPEKSQSSKAFFTGEVGRSLMKRAENLGYFSVHARSLVKNVLSGIDESLTSWATISESAAILGIDAERASKLFSEYSLEVATDTILDSEELSDLPKSRRRFMRQFIEDYHEDGYHEDGYVNIDGILREAIFRFLLIDPFTGLGLVVRRKFWAEYSSADVVSQGYDFLAEANLVREASLAAMATLGKEERAIGLMQDICIDILEGCPLSEALDHNIHQTDPRADDFPIQDIIRAKFAFWEVFDLTLDELGNPLLW